MPTLDVIDRELLHALHLDARVPLSRIAAVLGTSTQTVGRRYARLRSQAGLRIVGLTDPGRASRQQWFVRLSATPRAAQEIGRALARRADTSWVRLTSGGTEIVAIVQTTRGGADSHALLLRDIPRTSGVTAVSAHYLLHLYLGGPTAWRGRADALTPQQQDALRRPLAGPRPVTLDETDHGPEGEPANLAPGHSRTRLFVEQQVEKMFPACDGQQRPNFPQPSVARVFHAEIGIAAVKN